MLSQKSVSKKLPPICPVPPFGPTESTQGISTQSQVFPPPFPSSHAIDAIDHSLPTSWLPSMHVV